MAIDTREILEQIMRRLDALEARIARLEPVEYSSELFGGFGNPTAQVGLAAVNGTATTAMRSDGAPPIDQGIAPTWTAHHLFQGSGRRAIFRQNDATGNDEVIALRQDDTNEPFALYRGTAAAGNLNRSLVDEGDQASETRRGWIKCEIVDDGGQITSDDYFIPFYELSS